MSSLMQNHNVCLELQESFSKKMDEIRLASQGVPLDAAYVFCT